MIAIDKYAYISGLKDVNPLMKILFGGLSLVACVWSKSLLSFLIVLLVMSFLTVVKAKIPLRYYLGLMAIPLCFLLAGVLGIIANVTMLPVPEDCVFHYSVGNVHIFVTRHGLMTALQLTCRAMAAVSCLYFIILTTPVRDVMYFMGMLRCPNVMLTLALLVYHFIFLLMDVAVVKLKSQLCRDGYRSFKMFPKVFGMLWGSVFVQSFRKADWIFKSMSSRGYQGEIHQLPRDFRLNVREWLLLAAFVTIVLLPNLL